MVSYCYGKTSDIESEMNNVSLLEFNKISFNQESKLAFS